jgi:para-nitrobenzyl esterase
MPEYTVTTANGQLSGTRDGDLLCFKGIPYGESTAGENRFRPPVPKKPWAGVRLATECGPACPQPAMVDSPEGKLTDLSFLHQLSGGGITSSDEGYDEDCLTLSVWGTAEPGAKRPVFVWLHGGWFTFGSSNSAGYDGTRLADSGEIVVVGVNHRLGSLGYAYLAEVPGGDFVGTGNVGMLDVVLALEWVRDNIAAFGGDPGNVTLAGESGGASKVSMLLGMPAATDLFHAAIIQSGAMLRACEPADASQVAAALLDALSVSSVSELQQVPIDTLILAQERVLGGPMGGAYVGPRFAPVVDGTVLPAHPFDPTAAPSAVGVPVLVGTANNEMDVVATMIPGWSSLPADMRAQFAQAFGGADMAEILAGYARTRPAEGPLEQALAALSDQLRIGSIRLAERLVEAGGTAYMYRIDFDSKVLDGQMRAFHGCDLPLMFNNVEVSGLYDTNADAQAVADVMSATWAAFAHRHDPNNPCVPVWPTYDPVQRATMLFDIDSSVVNDPNADERILWEGKLAGM